MCLDVKSERLTAEEDIVVYKFLKKDLILNTDDPVPFSGIIMGVETIGVAINATLPGEDSRVRLFFLTNELRLNGSKPGLKPGNDFMFGSKYNYSWILDPHVSEGILTSLPLIISYVTPYRRVSVKIGETVKSDLEYPNKNFPTIDVGIHSLETVKGCKRVIERGDDVVIVKCIIPKGSEYYTGLFSEESSYASNALIYQEIVG